MRIIKRNGAEAEFDVQKIISAVSRANAQVEPPYQLTDVQIRL